MLDVLDSAGDIVADYALPTSQAFRFVKRELGLVVVRADLGGFYLVDESEPVRVAHSQVSA